MKITIRIAGFLGAMMAANLAFADIPECVNANHNNPADVQRCMSRIPNINIFLANPFPCRGIQMQISSERRGLEKEKRTLPTCKTIGDALAIMNGKRPAWYECTGYDGSQAQLNHCFGSLVSQAKTQNVKKEDTCMAFTFAMTSALDAVNDKDFKFAKNPITCEMAANAMSSQGYRMVASECLGYRPDDARHIEQCLTPTLSQGRGKATRMPTCDEARAIYSSLVRLAYSGDPAGYAMPNCSMIEPLAVRLLGGAAASGAVASQPATNPVPANYPAPANYPVATTNAPAPAATYNGGYTQPAVQTETREERRERKRAQRVENVQAGTEAVNQVMGLLGVSTAVGGNGMQPAPVATSQMPDAATTGTAPETEAQRKIREKQDAAKAVGDAAQTVKGVLNMFSR